MFTFHRIKLPKKIGARQNNLKLSLPRLWSQFTIPFYETWNFKFNFPSFCSRWQRGLGSYSHSQGKLHQAIQEEKWLFNRLWLWRISIADQLHWKPLLRHYPGQLWSILHCHLQRSWGDRLERQLYVSSNSSSDRSTVSTHSNALQDSSLSDKIQALLKKREALSRLCSDVTLKDGPLWETLSSPSNFILFRSELLSVRSMLRVSKHPPRPPRPPPSNHLISSQLKFLVARSKTKRPALSLFELDRKL